MREFPSQLLTKKLMQGWKIDSFIGEGGSGCVYRIENIKTGEKAALKWIRLSSFDRPDMSKDAFTQAHQQVLTEILNQKELSGYEEIVQIQDYEVVNSAGQTLLDVLIRMELLTPLTDILRENRLTVAHVLSILQDIGHALQFCHHQKNIVHGDIKLENILAFQKNGRMRFKLGDFGIAVHVNQNRDARTGTIIYQPPEFRAEKKLSPQGDIFSLGLLAYKLLNNGLLPGQKNDSPEAELDCLELRHALYLRPGESLPPLPAHGAESLGRIVCKAAACAPCDRYADVTDLLKDLQAAIDGMTPSQLNALLINDSDGKEDFVAIQQKMFLSTRHDTPSYFNSAKPEAPAAPQPAPARPAAASSTFEMPEAEAAPAPQPAPAASDVPPPAPKKKKAWRWIVPLMLVLALLVAAAVYFLTTDPTDTLSLEVKINQCGFETVIESACVPETGWKYFVFPASAPENRTEISAFPFSLGENAPGSQFTITAEKGARAVTHSFRSSEAAQATGSFRMKLYQAPSSYLRSEENVQKVAQQISWHEGGLSNVSEISRISFAELSESNASVLMILNLSFSELPTPDELRIILQMSDGAFQIWNLGETSTDAESCMIALSLAPYLQDVQSQRLEGEAVLGVYWGQQCLTTKSITVKPS